MEGPLVSVVVPAFNAAPTIGQTLDSIANQTYRSLDIVVIDDVSLSDHLGSERVHQLSMRLSTFYSKPALQ